jgi:hypothetical protein
VFIETGTYQGNTLGGVLQDFETLVSIELDQSLHESAVRRFAEHPKVKLLPGDSAKRLTDAFNLAGGRPALIWLDAHFSGPGTSKGAANTPILDEIKIVLSRAGPRDIIMIDDLRCFAPPSPNFEWDAALEGYPAASDVAKLFTGRGYKVLVMCDALIALPQSVFSEVRTTAVLRACRNCG